MEYGFPAESSTFRREAFSKRKLALDVESGSLVCYSKNRRQ